MTISPSNTGGLHCCSFFGVARPGDSFTHELPVMPSESVAKSPSVRPSLRSRLLRWFSCSICCWSCPRLREDGGSPPPGPRTNRRQPRAPRWDGGPRRACISSRLLVNVAKERVDRAAGEVPRRNPQSNGCLTSGASCSKGAPGRVGCLPNSACGSRSMFRCFRCIGQGGSDPHSGRASPRTGTGRCRPSRVGKGPHCRRGNRSSGTVCCVVEGHVGRSPSGRSG